MSIAAALAPPPPLRHLIPFSAMPYHGLFKQFFSTVQNLKSTLLLKSPKSTPSVIKPCVNFYIFFTSKALTTTGFSNPLTLHAPTIFFFRLCLPVYTPSSMRIFDSRIKYLGHILPIANPSLTLRTTSAPFRRGAPQAHWPELSLAESSHGVQHYRNSPPILGNF